MNVNESSQKVDTGDSAKATHKKIEFEQNASQTSRSTTKEQLSEQSLSVQQLRRQSQQSQIVKNNATQAALKATQTSNITATKAPNSAPIQTSIQAKVQPSIDTNQNMALQTLKELPLNDKLVQILSKAVLQDAYNRGVPVPTIIAQAKAKLAKNTSPINTQTDAPKHVQTKIKLSQEQSSDELNPKQVKQEASPKINSKITQYQNMLGTHSSKTLTAQPKATNSGEATKQQHQEKSTQATYKPVQLTQTQTVIDSNKDQQSSTSNTPVKSHSVDIKTQSDSDTKHHIQQKVETTTPDAIKENAQLKTQKNAVINIGKEKHFTPEQVPKQKIQLIKKSPMPEHNTKLLLKRVLVSEMPKDSPDTNDKKTHQAQTFEQKVANLISNIKTKQIEHQSEKQTQYEQVLYRSVKETEFPKVKIDISTLETPKSKPDTSAPVISVDNKNINHTQNQIDKHHQGKTASVNTAQTEGLDVSSLESIFANRKSLLLSTALGLLSNSQGKPSEQNNLVSLLQNLLLPTTSTEVIGQWLKNRPDNKALAKALEQVQQGQLQDISLAAESLKDEGKATVRLLAEQRVSELRQNTDSNISYTLPNPHNPDKPIQLRVRRGGGNGTTNTTHRERWNISLNFDLGDKGLLRMNALWEKKELSLNIKSDSHALLSSAKIHLGIIEKHLSAMGIKHKSASFQLLTSKKEEINSSSKPSGLHIKI